MYIKLTFVRERTYKKSFCGDISVSCKILLPGSIIISSYSPAFVPDIRTFFMAPSEVPRNANECGPVVVAVTDVIETLSKWNKARAVTGETPLIFNPTLQKL